MNKSQEWYGKLRKPMFAPPAWIFGPVWSGLYLIIAVTYVYVVYAAFMGIIPKMLLAPFILNLIFNVLYTPIQFGLRNLVLATVDIFLVLSTLIVALLAIYPYYPWIALANLPYVAWVSFATVLQVTITFMNRTRT